MWPEFGREPDNHTVTMCWRWRIVSKDSMKDSQGSGLDYCTHEWADVEMKVEDAVEKPEKLDDSRSAINALKIHCYNGPVPPPYAKRNDQRSVVIRLENPQLGTTSFGLLSFADCGILRVNGRRKRRRTKYIHGLPLELRGTVFDKQKVVGGWMEDFMRFQVRQSSIYSYTRPSVVCRCICSTCYRYTDWFHPREWILKDCIPVSCFM